MANPAPMIPEGGRGKAPASWNPDSVYVPPAYEEGADAWLSRQPPHVRNSFEQRHRAATAEGQPLEGRSFGHWMYHQGHSNARGDFVPPASETSTAAAARHNLPVAASVPPRGRSPAQQEYRRTHPYVDTHVYEMGPDGPAFTPRAPNTYEKSQADQLITRATGGVAPVRGSSEDLSVWSPAELRRAATDLNINHEQFDGSPTGISLLRQLVQQQAERHAAQQKVSEVVVNPDGVPVYRPLPGHGAQTQITPGPATAPQQRFRNSVATDLVAQYQHLFDTPDQKEDFRQQVFTMARNGDAEGIRNLRAELRAQQQGRQREAVRQNASVYNLGRSLRQPGEQSGGEMARGTVAKMLLNGAPAQQIGAAALLQPHNPNVPEAIAAHHAAQAAAAARERELAQEAPGAKEAALLAAREKARQDAFATPGFWRRVDAVQTHLMDTHPEGAALPADHYRQQATEQVIQRLLEDPDATPDDHKRAVDAIRSMPQPQAVAFLGRLGWEDPTAIFDDIVNPQGRGLERWINWATGTTNPPVQNVTPPERPGPGA